MQAHKPESDIRLHSLGINLRVYHAARGNLVVLRSALDGAGGFGDLHNQMKRAAISVVSNIAEGYGLGNDRGFLRHLRIARGSNTELQAQLGLGVDLDLIAADHAIHHQVDAVGRMLSRLIARIAFG